MFQNPYLLAQAEKEAALLPGLVQLTEWHGEHCPEYANLLRQCPGPYLCIDDLPFIPTTIFKRRLLSSLGDKPATIVASSSTSGTPSRVLIDADTARLQTRSVHAIYSDFIGPQKRPYLIFDPPGTARGKGQLATRGAALLSLMHHASEYHFLVRSDGGFDFGALSRATQNIRDAGGRFVAFGFTYAIYQWHQLLKEAQWRVEGIEGHIIHSGGWKRMIEAQVSKPELNALVSGIWGLPSDRIIDSYGLTEQLGVIYPDCQAGNKHPPRWADILIRNPHTLDVMESGVGMIQLVSLVSHSMPNHSVLTDDLGEVVGVDNCPCGRKGKAFRFIGRAKGGELRGCGDVKL